MSSDEFWTTVKVLIDRSVKQSFKNYQISDSPELKNDSVCRQKVVDADGASLSFDNSTPKLPPFALRNIVKRHRIVLHCNEPVMETGNAELYRINDAVQTPPTTPQPPPSTKKHRIVLRSKEPLIDRATVERSRLNEDLIPLPPTQPPPPPPPQQPPPPPPRENGVPGFNVDFENIPLPNSASGSSKFPRSLFGSEKSSDSMSIASDYDEQNVSYSALKSVVGSSSSASSLRDARPRRQPLMNSEVYRQMSLKDTDLRLTLLSMPHRQQQQQQKQEHQKQQQPSSCLNGNFQRAVASVTQLNYSSTSCIDGQNIKKDSDLRLVQSEGRRKGRNFIPSLMSSTPVVDMQSFQFRRKRRRSSDSDNESRSPTRRRTDFSAEKSVDTTLKLYTPTTGSSWNMYKNYDQNPNVSNVSCSSSQQFSTGDERSKYTYFFTKKYPFSNHYPCKYRCEGQIYCCTEQQYMYEKAKLFKDESAMKELLATKDPKAMKNIGRSVSGFVQSQWNKVSVGVMTNANYAKYTQNRQLRLSLFATEGTTLVETNPSDNIWGIGLTMDDPRSWDSSQWRGKNLLGQILSQLRDDLISQPQYADEVSMVRADKSQFIWWN